jgi:hypothetical protein
MGLLDNIFATQQPEYMTSLLGQDAVDKLKKQSLISGGVNTLVGYLAAPKNQRLGLGRILAGAYQQGMQGAQGTYDKATQDYITGLKMQDLKKSAEAKKKMEELAPNLFTQATPAQYETQNIYGASPPMLDETGQPIAPNLNPQVVDTRQVMTTPEGKPQINYETLQKMLGVDVAAAAPYLTSASNLKSLMTPVKEQLTVVPQGGRVIDAAGKVIAEGMPKETSVTDAPDRYAIETYGVPFKDLTQSQAAVVNKLVIADKKASATTINMPSQETSEKKTVGEAFGKQYATIQEAGFKSNSMINNAQRLNTLLDKVNTGKLTPLGVDIASAAESLGFKGIDPKLGNKQAAESLSNEMALQLRNPSGGAGMPGALSDADRVYLQSMTPNLTKTPEGRKLISETMITLAKRDQDVAKLARDYRKKNGGFDEGFYDELAKWSAANPLFTQQNKTVEVTY